MDLWSSDGVNGRGFQMQLGWRAGSFLRSEDRKKRDSLFYLSLGQYLEKLVVKILYNLIHKSLRCTDGETEALGEVMAPGVNVSPGESSLFSRPRLLPGDCFFKNSTRDPEDGEREKGKPSARQHEFL